MDFLVRSLTEAFCMILSFDAELYAIIGLSLYVSFFAVLFASLLGIPMGFWLAVSSFPGKRGVITLVNTCLALPTVVIGLFVYVFLSRSGPFGFLGWLYTPKAIIIGQLILILPWVVSLTLTAVNRVDARYYRTALTLGATALGASLTVVREARFGILAAVIAAFARAIAEIGIAMMLGGNIRGFTRTMTTAMALEHNKGEFVLAVALGLVLLAVSLAMNVVLQMAQGRYGEGA
ncbi:ABC transporter permease [Desulfobotulus sp. H1]|uniref:ABC transporter permease n=1 Tax=Desulfobotulus pelophilus TaxID=2823377 RepID=A0ABT3N7A1_9BACT|nr:ABC transporter permease [Desulfobotulus pelophilus]MCW7753336.1 ABC transporter permease [Desulfobotulus pelophilus]